MLHVYTTRIQSQCGLRLGDPLGPLMFPPTLQLVLKRSEAGMDVDPLVAYLNNASIVGSPTAGAAPFKRLLDDEKRLPSISLEPNIGKCGVDNVEAEEVAVAQDAQAHALETYLQLCLPARRWAPRRTSIRSCGERQRSSSPWWTPWS